MVMNYENNYKAPWYSFKSSEEVGRALVSLALKHRDTLSARAERAVRLLSLYEGLNLTSFQAGAYDSAPLDDEDGDYEEYDGPLANIGASIMDSIDAKLFAGGKIKSQFVVTDGGWDAKRAAILASRFVEGQMAEPQGIFSDGWAVWRHAARLAETCTGTAAVFFWSDPDQGKIVWELDDTLHMYVETSGLPYDGIVSVVRITEWDPENLSRRMPEHREKIFQAIQRPENALYNYSRDSDEGPTENELGRVALVQGWRMATPAKGGKLTPGVYCAAIAGTTLRLEEYQYEEPPFVYYTPMRQLAGFWGRTRLERIVGPHRKFNEILRTLTNATNITPRGAVVYDKSTTDPEVLSTIKDVVLIPYTGPPEKAPKYSAPQPFHPIVLDFAKYFQNLCFDLSGMSEAQVTASREKGLASGVAIRLVQDQVYERFAPSQDEYERCVGPATARQIIRCAKEIQQAKGGFNSVWKSAESGGFLREIPSSVFDILDKYKYTIETHAVSGNVNTPADRVDLAEKLMSSGVITGEAYSAIIQHFDVPGHHAIGTEKEKAEAELVERLVDSWTLSSIEGLEDAYVAPEKWMNLDQRLLQTGAAYTEFVVQTMGDKSEETSARTEYFLRYLSDLEALIVEKQMISQQMATRQYQQHQAQQPQLPHQQAPIMQVPAATGEQ